jgi:hypothetical protein
MCVAEKTSLFKSNIMAHYSACGFKLLTILNTKSMQKLNIKDSDDGA